MKGVTSKILIALGIIFILAAILWWAIAVNALVKLPDDVDSTTSYEGEMTWYVNPLTNEPLPEGQEETYELNVDRMIVADAGEFDSSKGVIGEEVVLRIGPLPEQKWEFAYVLDRKNLENVDDDRAYAYEPDNVVNREGSYYPLLPFDTSKDETYMIWKNEIGEPVESEFDSEEEKEGVTVYNFRGAFEQKEVTDAFLEANNLPSETTFESLEPTLAAMGVDVGALLALAQQTLEPADLQALDQALAEPIPLTYYWALETKVSVEPKTGVPVDVYENREALTMELDMTKLAGIFTILGKYADDPALGPALAQLTELQSELAEMEPQKIFEYSYQQTDETVKSAIDDAKDGASQINLVKVYIPWALLIVGALILIIGLLIGGGAAPQAEPTE